MPALYAAAARMKSPLYRRSRTRRNFAPPSMDCFEANGSTTPLTGKNGTQKLGWFQLMLQNAVADGVQVKTIASGDGGNTWYDEKFWEPKLYMSVADTSNGTQPLPVKELVAQMVVDTSIARTDGLDLSNEVTLDGSATLEVKYL
mgnify:CR=1 FL=1